jgi:ferrous iron transport protein B
MAIFFPAFTLLEDLGYLPRVAFVLDHAFRQAGACGKQALTMCQGLGCNACGVTGCRIIDSPRERLIAILTNCLVPCNGRFPTLIALITIFFVGDGAGVLTGLGAAVLLLGVLVLGVAGTLACSRLLSATVLKGMPSSFTLELPPFRKPRVGQVVVRSLLDRTLFVLGRAAAVAAPAGAVIWLLANVTVGEATVLAHCTRFLDPFARLFGLDGVILMAFLLGWPANEIVIPVMLMAYLSCGRLVELDSLTQLGQLLTANGWTWNTAVCTMLFSLFHWPCSTTCITVYRETKSLKWTAWAVLLPTALGFALCFLVNLIA